MKEALEKVIRGIILKKYPIVKAFDIEEVSSGYKVHYYLGWDVSSSDGYGLLNTTENLSKMVLNKGENVLVELSFYYE
jgi:hypothetical protein